MSEGMMRGGRGCAAVASPPPPPIATLSPLPLYPRTIMHARNAASSSPQAACVPGPRLGLTFRGRSAGARPIVWRVRFLVGRKKKSVVSCNLLHLISFTLSLSHALSLALALSLSLPTPHHHRPTAPPAAARPRTPAPWAAQRAAAGPCFLPPFFRHQFQLLA